MYCCQKKLKILHLEDSPSDALLIKNELTRSKINFERLLVDTREKFIDALDNYIPDVVLADHSLPSFDSIEALTIFQRKSIKVPFILVTAAMSDEFAVSTINKGADDYILKDRLNRLPIAIVNAVEKFRLKKDREFFIDELVKKEKRYRAIVESSTDAVVIFDRNGKPTYATPSVESILGYTDKEVMQMNIFSLAHPNDLDDIAEVMKKALANPGTPIQGHTAQLLHKDGSFRWIEATITNMLHDSAINGIIDNFRDITERKEAELSIKESEEKYRSFFENSMDGILLTVSDGVVLAANPAACAIFGMSEAEICAAGRFGLVDKSDPRVAAGIEERQNAGKAKIEVTLIRKNGEYFPGELSSVIYTTSMGELRSLMIVRDISERKFAEVKIIQLNRLYSFISQINQTIVHSNDEETVFKEACRIAIEIGGFKAAWIGMLDKENNKVSLRESFGILHEDLIYYKNIPYKTDGPFGYILESGSYYYCNNIEENFQSEYWKVFAKERGVKSYIILPLKKSNEVIGCFILSGSELNIFTTQEIALLEEATGDISFAMDVLEKQRQKLIADEVIKHKESRLNQAQALAHVGSWELDFSTGIAIWSEEQLRIFGISTSETKQTYQSWVSYIHPDDRAQVLRKTNETKTTHADTGFFHRIIRPDGIIRFLHSQTRFEFDNDGVPKGLYGATLDVTDMKESETALRKSETNLKNISHELQKAVTGLNKIMDSSLDIICSIDEDGRFVSVSSASDAIWGYKPEEIIGKKYMDMVFSVDAEHTRQVAEKIVSGRPVTMFENQYVHKSGRIIPILWSARWDSNDKLMYCIAKDATEKKRLEKAFESERRRFLDMFIQAPSSIGILKGPNHIFEMVNPLYLKLIGKKNIIGKTVKEALPEIVEQGFIELLDSVYQTGRSYTGTEVLIKLDKDGTGKLTNAYVNFIYQAYTNAIGIIDGIFFFAIDVSEQVFSRKKIERSELKYRQIVETAQEGIWLVDKTDKTTFVNQKLCDIFGYEKEEMLEKDIHYFMHHDEKETPSNLIVEKEKGKSFEGEFKYIAKDGREIWTNVSANPVFDEDENYNGVLAMITDISQRKEQQIQIKKHTEEREVLIKELSKSLKDLKEFTYITSHNFRAPLSNLSGLLSLIDYSKLDKTNSEIVEMFKTSTNQLNKTINDLIQILIIRNNKNVDIAPNSIDVVVSEVENSLIYEIKKINCVIKKDFEVTNVSFNHSYLESILMNLLSNAIKYRSPIRDLQINISTKLNPDGKVILTIEDNGLGIDLKRHSNYVFGLYQRFHSNTQGEGLGLFMVKSQMTALGGAITVESKVDAGTTFILTFNQ
jgi:PAS domain S-box-containing protein